MAVLAVPTPAAVLAVPTFALLLDRQGREGDRQADRQTRQDRQTETDKSQTEEVAMRVE